MQIEIATLFPEMCEAVLSASILGRARAKGAITVNCHQIRAYTKDKHNRVDDSPFGGGMGMVMQAQPIYDAYRSIADALPGKPRVLHMTPQGRVFDQNYARELALEKDLIFLCGHYEGIDERVLDEIATDHVSIGDFVLTGGELPAMCMIDAISRMVPGVLHNSESAEDDSFGNGLLEFPQYTRPEVWNGRTVPPILLSGDHAKVDAWRREQSLIRTAERRPDLFERAAVSPKERAFIENYLANPETIE